MTKISNPAATHALSSASLVRPSSLGIETSQLDPHELQDPAAALSARIEQASSALTTFIQADLLQMLEPSIMEPLKNNIQSIIQLQLLPACSGSGNLSNQMERVERFACLLRIFSEVAPAAIGLSSDGSSNESTSNRDYFLGKIATHWQLWFETLESARLLNKELKKISNNHKKNSS